MPVGVAQKRNTDLTRANYVRTLKKRRRWAQELREAGWTVIEPQNETTDS